jgi:hypothetical protein
VTLTDEVRSLEFCVLERGPAGYMYHYGLPFASIQSMSLFEDLAGVDSQRAFGFFLENLRETPPAADLRDDQLFYVTSILAHYALTSRFDTTSMPSMADLAEVFDNFLLHPIGANDAEMLEFGGSLVLLFAGFFRDQMDRRHNVRWYDQVGQSMYEKAGQYARDVKKRTLFDGLSESFPVWTIVCRNLHRTLRDNRLLIRVN